jgi:DNA-binding response OmpR family regulator
MHQRRYHILVADEDHVSLHQAVNLLKRRDYVVAGAPTLDEAQWWLAGWPVDLVVTSQQFGPGTGIQLILNARSSQPEVVGLIKGSEQALASADAQRYGVQMVEPAAGPDEFLARVAESLSTITRRQRWPRKEVTGPIPMRIGESPCRLMDVSYGGLKFELTDEPYVLRSPVEIDFPRADLRLHAEVIWSARREHGKACVFGASITPDPTPATEWRSFVDRLA